MSQKLNNIVKFLLKYEQIVVAIIVTLIGILSIFITAYFNCTFYHPEEKTSFKFSFGIIEIVLTTVFFFFILFCTKKFLKKIPSYIILIPILFFSIILFIYWINALKLNPETDQKLIHDMAIAFLDGNISNFTDTAQYLFLYPYQFALTFFVSIIYKFFGQNFLYIEYINAICSIINITILYIISKKIFNNNENIQKVLVILLACFVPYWMFFNVHFYGNIIGLTLALIATLLLIFYLEKNNILYIFFSGVFLGISVLIKTNYLIFLCANIIILLCHMFESSFNKENLPEINNKFSKYKNLIKFKYLSVPLFIIGYLIINLSYENFIQGTLNISSDNGVPMITFIYMGMDEPTNLSPGWYNGITAELYKNNNYDKVKTR